MFADGRSTPDGGPIRRWWIERIEGETRRERKYRSTRGKRERKKEADREIEFCLSIFRVAWITIKFSFLFAPRRNRISDVKNEKSIDTRPYTPTFPLLFVRDPESRVFHDTSARARARNDSHTVIHDRAKVPRCSHSKKPYTRRGLGNRARTRVYLYSNADNTDRGKKNWQSWKKIRNPNRRWKTMADSCWSIIFRRYIYFLPFSFNLQTLIYIARMYCTRMRAHEYRKNAESNSVTRSVCSDDAWCSWQQGQSTRRNYAVMRFIGFIVNHTSIVIVFRNADVVRVIRVFRSSAWHARAKLIVEEISEFRLSFR